MKIDITGKIAVVTGGAKGIGAVISKRLAQEGAIVEVWDVDENALSLLDADCKKDGLELEVVECDVTDCRMVQDRSESLKNRLGRIDILVANAGVAHFAPTLEMSEREWQNTFDVNVNGVFHCAKNVGAVMEAQRSGRIIIASSFAAIIPSLASAAYAASKSALLSLTRVLAAELGGSNITVNSYAPGMIPTGMSGVDKMSSAKRKRLLNTLSVKKWGSAEDIASLVIFLASDKASYITGTHIDASGGKFAVQINEDLS